MSEWNVPNGEMIEKFVEHMDMMLDHMNESYREWMDRGEDRHGTRARMCSEYHASLTFSSLIINLLLEVILIITFIL